MHLELCYDRFGSSITNTFIRQIASFYAPYNESMSGRIKKKDVLVNSRNRDIQATKTGVSGVGESYILSGRGDGGQVGTGTTAPGVENSIKIACCWDRYGAYVQGTVNITAKLYGLK